MTVALALAVLTALDTAKRLGLRVKDYRNADGSFDAGKVAVHSAGLSEESIKALSDWRRYCHLQPVAGPEGTENELLIDLLQPVIGKNYAWFYFERSAFEAATYHDAGHFKNILADMYSKPEPATFAGVAAQLKEAASILKGVKADAAGYKHSMVWEAFSVGNGYMGEKHSIGLFATEALATNAAKGSGMGGADGFVEARKVYHEAL